MNKLRQARINSGLKVKKIASELKITRAHYYNLERGITKITDDKAEILAKLLNIPKSEVKRCENERIYKTSN